MKIAMTWRSAGTLKLADVEVPCFVWLFSKSPLFPCPLFSDQLYFAILQQRIKSTAERHCFCIDDELSYEKYVLLQTTQNRLFYIAFSKFGAVGLVLFPVFK